MAIHRIRQLGDPILRERSHQVSEAPQTLQDLRDTLHEFQRTHGFGRGISAVQIGKLERVIYIEFEGRDYAMVNPVYLEQSDETFQLWDDCFSFPDLMCFVERASRVKVQFGEEVLVAEGALSELIQHEMDHLDGVLAVDRVIGRGGLMTREEWKRAAATAQPLSGPGSANIRKSV